MGLKVIQDILNGSYYDNIVAFLRYGIEKAPLSPEDKIIFDRIEWVKEQWQTHRDDALVVKNIMTEFKVSNVQAYVYLANAKRIWSLFISYDPMVELMLWKERIDKAFELAEENPKAFAKLYASALEQNGKWIEKMNEEIARTKPENTKTIEFIYTTDVTKLPGMTLELEAEWNKEFDGLEQKSRSKFKHLNFDKAETVTDVSYSQ
jgi:hypothetical protein